MFFSYDRINIKTSLSIKFKWELLNIEEQIDSHLQKKKNCLHCLRRQGTKFGDNFALWQTKSSRFSPTEKEEKAVRE